MKAEVITFLKVKTFKDQKDANSLLQICKGVQFRAIVMKRKETSLYMHNC